MSELHDRIEEFYNSSWSYDQWSQLAGYTHDDLTRVRAAYTGSVGLRAALIEDVYEKTVLRPWIGEHYEACPLKIAIVLREYPIASVATSAFPMNSGRMRCEVDHATTSHTGYSTLRRALAVAGRCLEQHGCVRSGFLPDRITSAADLNRAVKAIAQHVYVTDLVKPFALYRDYKGKRLSDSNLSRSCHTHAMYNFARGLLGEEMNLANADLVLGFGKGWGTRYTQAHGKTVGKATLVVLRHPAARGFAWRKLDAMVAPALAAAAKLGPECPGPGLPL